MWMLTKVAIGTAVLYFAINHTETFMITVFVALALYGILGDIADSRKAD